MATYDLDEQERLDELKAWWKRWGNLLLLAAAVAVAAGAGWRYWQHRSVSQGLEAAAVYEQLVLALTTNDTAFARRARFLKDHAMSPGATVRPGTKRKGVDVPKRRVGYYVSQKGLKHGFASCPIKRVPAGFTDDLVRGMVLDYLQTQHDLDLRELEPELRDRKLRDVVTAVVLAPEDAAAAARVRAAGAMVAVNPQPSAGLGASLACGVAALPDALDGVLVLLGDMPRVRAATCRALLDAFERAPPTAALAPVHVGTRGHPVLFGVAHRPALAALTGDVGARRVLAAADVVPIAVDDPGILLDVDTPEDLARAAGAPPA